MSETTSYDSLANHISLGSSRLASSDIPSGVPMASSFEMVDIGKFTIPLFVGTVINWALLGTLAVQVYIYYLAFPKDRRSSKLVVAFVVVAEFLQTLANSRDSIRMFGAGWGNPQVLDDIGWAWFSVPILGSLIASVGQIFFAWRIYIIAKSLYVPILIALVTTLQLGAGIWSGVVLIRLKEFSKLRLMMAPVAWLSATSLSDLIIVAGMVFYLLKAKEPEFTRQIKATLTRIIKVTVETGILCAVAAIVVLSLCLAFEGNNYHLGVCIWLSKVYSNSIMIVSAFSFAHCLLTQLPFPLSLKILNSRARIGHDPTAPGATTKMMEMTEVVFNSSVGPTSTTQSSVQAIDITADEGPNVPGPESKGDVAKHRSEWVV
ncbi:hypothetical protein MSAN_01725400 [Mycena sanguinolenta]|uniref:DUF6534 domain-containing protein n=1 Tax=Mycena sanguinolenta TaxID=230812 RepID=A0A8H6XZQ6_9AGAR|nr:hypothetical protein MSAN_01725400 [Mycena sanguinolenta]